MSFFSFAPSSDDRNTMAPMTLQNMILEKVPDGAPKPVKYALKPWPGLVSRGTIVRTSPAIPQNCRGLYSQSGVAGSFLYGVFGTGLYKINPDYSATLVSSAGGPVTQFAALRNKLLALGNDLLRTYDGTTTGGVSNSTDADFPANPWSMTTLDQRVIVTAKGADQFYWSDVLDAVNYGATSFATSERRPDEIIACGAKGGDLWLFGASGTEVLRGGGSATLPFQSIRSIDINKGCAARDSLRLIQSDFFWLAEDRCLYRSNGYSPARIDNLAMEEQLRTLTAQQLSECIAFSYEQESQLFYVLRPPVGSAWALDIGMGTWTELTTWGADAYRVTFTAHAYGKTFCAALDDESYYTFENDIYTDDGVVIERIATFGVPSDGRVTVDSLAFDMQTNDAPLSGQGSSPSMMVEYWKDSGRYTSGAAGVIRNVNLPRRGQYTKKPMLWRLGQVNAQDGLIAKCTITDPVDPTFYGVRVNEGMP